MPRNSSALQWVTRDEASLERGGENPGKSWIKMKPAYYKADEVLEGCGAEALLRTQPTSRGLDAKKGLTMCRPSLLFPSRRSRGAGLGEWSWSARSAAGGGMWE